MFTNFADFIPALVIVSIPATAIAIVIGFAFQAFQNRKKSRALDAADSAAIAAAE
jgi:hypothetical protein